MKVEIDEETIDAVVVQSLKDTRAFLKKLAVSLREPEDPLLIDAIARVLKYYGE